jgi:hypothetical protein
MSILKTVARFVGIVLYVAFIVFHRPISWVLALTCVGLSCGACVGELSVWPAALCFAAMVGQHLVPVEAIERALGLNKQSDRI